jgi:hypothetical protein
VRLAGFDVTQATLSRDIRELGLVKGGADGAYQAVRAERANGHGGRSLLHRALTDYLTRIDRVAAARVCCAPVPVKARCSVSPSMGAVPRGCRHARRRRYDPGRHARRAACPCFVKRLETLARQADEPSRASCGRQGPAPRIGRTDTV